MIESQRTRQSAVGGCLLACLLAMATTRATAQETPRQTNDAAPAAAAPAPADASDGTRRDVEVDDAARVLFERGVDAYRAGDYETALERFEQAYTITGDPELLYNVGTTLDRLRRDADAVEAFERYLAERPDAPNRDAVERRLVDLRANLAPQPEPEPVVVEEAPRGVHRAAFWSGVGVTAVLAGVSIWSGVDAVRRNDDYENAVSDGQSMGGTREDVRPLLDDAQGAQRRTNWLLAGTATAAAATLVLAFFTDWGGEDAEDGTSAVVATPLPLISVSADGAVVGVSARF